MFDFFGTFLDGPLAGSTFGGVINDGSGGDSVGPFLALGGMAFVLAIDLKRCSSMPVRSIRIRSAAPEPSRSMRRHLMSLMTARRPQTASR